ncbi:hypothetical protein BDV96DRAFT_642443 [Lophiotrema nucula]|uniref:PARG catalytic Macro domain-containing protein n=1 Tax=Lophiotrema nucula TaxID=690887 RepID=A0A6A5ZLU6_9PLEO|nr:hypothetical protein BDV96DRAFT_642443 [Lophiotrema nucula]
MPYLLPSHPSLKSDDPLGILDTEDGLQWDVLDALLQAATKHATKQPPAEVFPALIEDIAYSLHSNGSMLIENLRSYLLKLEVPSWYAFACLNLLIAAKNLAQRFPDGVLHPLHLDGDAVTYNGKQINSLLAHQALGSLGSPEGTSWGLPDFTSWYKGNPAHSQAVEGYLDTLFNHFANGGYALETFTFSMFSPDTMPNPSMCTRVPNVHLHTTTVESEPSQGTEPVFVLVAAHSQPGPGATATQEERLQNASLALSVSALVTPVLPENGAVVTSAFPVHAAWEGHNRTAKLTELYKQEKRPERHYILADALQIDELDNEGEGLSDLQPGRVEREARKLYAAFTGASKVHATSQSGPCIIETGAWGCGAFGGNVVVKTACIMIAAALTEIELHLTLLEHRKQDIKDVRLLLEKEMTAAALWERVTAPSAGRITEPLQLLSD